MPTIFVTTPQTPNGFTIISSSTLIFSQSSSVFHDDGNGISIFDGAAFSTTVVVNTDVATGSGNQHNGIRADGADTIMIGTNGAVYGGFDAFLSAGVYAAGNGNSIENAGYITGNAGILSDSGSGTDMTVTNSGTINALTIGIGAQAAGSSVTNSGTISSDGIGYIALNGGHYLANSGTIVGGGDGNGLTGAAVWFDSNASLSRNVLVNSGTIIAEAHQTSGQRLAVIDANYTTGDLRNGSDVAITEVQNTGTISGDINLGAGNDVLFNDGSIIGEVYMGEDNDFVRNDGTIDESVYLGEENDVFISGLSGVVTGIVFGEHGDDALFGGDSADEFWGGFENDTLRGFGGDDTLLGDDGNDVIGGGNGDDSMDGGLGNDTMNGGAGNDTLNGGNGNDSMNGGADDDVLFGNSKNDTLRGGTGDDTLDGGNDDDMLFGQQGNDELFGTAGFDTLYGGGGDDVLDGGGRADLLAGGTGNDTMTGGGSNDRFIFDRNAGNDVVTDFTDGADLIDLSAFGLQNFNRLNLLGALNEEQGGTWIDLGALGGSGTIWLDGVALAALDSSDFIF